MIAQNGISLIGVTYTRYHLYTILKTRRVSCHHLFLSRDVLRQESRAIAEGKNRTMLL